MTEADLSLDSPLIIGFGVTGQAVAAALVKRGIKPSVVEDRPRDSTPQQAEALGVDLVLAPSEDELVRAVSAASVLLPSPGVPDHHPAFEAARQRNVPVRSEFDLAALWDDRPIVGITGTNGKTTVTMMVTEALNRSGRRAEAVGNTEVPLVAAIDDNDTEVFVVEASSFRLGHSHQFSPVVGAWLNFAPDHLDAHVSLESYEEAKASIWNTIGVGGRIVANADDPVVMRHVPQAHVLQADGPQEPDHPISIERFSLSQPVEWRVESTTGRLVDGIIVGPDGPLVSVAELPRKQPHDVANALAASAIALGAGATVDGVKEMLTGFTGLPHRLQLVGTSQGVTWYNDSKATVPHATVVAVSGFESVVLIAGGRNKGLSMGALEATVPPVRAVVATGDAADEITAVYDPLVPVEQASSMVEAVKKAQALANNGDVVVLSPACTSFDWYPNYGERGRHFIDLVNTQVLGDSETKVAGE